MKKLMLLIFLLPIGVLAQNQARMISGTNNITTCPYTIQKQDVTKLDVFITSTPCAVTLPAATTGGYGKGSIFSVKNNGTGSVTITIGGGETIDSNTSVVLLPGAGMDIYSTGTGYSTQPGSGSGGGGGGGINPPAGDIGGNAVVPLVISTHLNSPLPILQGGTGTQTPALIAGTNVTITGSWPNQTISTTSACWQNNGSVLTCEPYTNAVPPVTATVNSGNSTIDISVAPCAAGGSHTSGIVTDPGVSPDLTQFLRSDCTFAVPSAVVTSVPNPLTAANLSNTTAPWEINTDVSFGGNNPYIDIRTYGARAVLPNSAPAVPGITASITGGVASATISSASTFQNGDGVVIWGAGATNVMSTPAAPTVTPSISASETGSLLDVTGPTGATSYSYQIVARDVNGGLTAASTATNISTGQATLGPNAISISSISLSNNTVSVVTSGAHTLAVGGLVIIEGVTVTGGINPFNGWFIVGASADNTHFTYNTMSDSRNGAVTTGASGNAHWWNSNHITWTAVTGAFQYYIYGRTGGSMALIGVSWPQNSGFTSERTHLAFDDFGSTLTTAPGLPAYVPTGTPPVSATNDMLITTISSGAGTTSLTLAANAGNTVTGATILFDNGTALLAAANAANISNTTSGTVYIPWPSTPFAYFVINSPITLPNYSAILQNGTVYLNETMTASGVTWKGMSRQQGAYPQFAISKTQQIYINNANPGIYTTDTSFFSFTTLQGQHLTNNNLMLEDLTGGGIPAGTLESVQFGLSVGGGTDYMSTGLVIRGNHAVGGASDMILHNVTFVSSQNTAYTTSCTPGLYADNFGSFSIDHIFFSGRGLLHRPTTSGGNIIGDGFSYAQANYMPMYASTNVDGGVISSNVKLTNVTLDTTLQPAFANLSNGGLSMNLILEYSTGVSNAATVTGSPTTFVNFFGPVIPAPGMNASNESTFNANVNDGVFGRTNGLGLRTENASIQIGSGYSLFTAGNSPAAPTCSANSGGSVPVSTLSYVYVPVWPNGSEGTPSLACSVTTTGGNQTVGMTWTAVTGAKGYNIYRNNFLANIGGCGTPQVTTASGTDSSSFTCGTGQPTAFAGSGGPAGMQGGNIWGNTETIGQYIDFAGLGSAPSNPAAGFCRTYYDSVAGTTKGINSTGASCSPTGGGGGSGTVVPALQNSVTYYDQAGTVAHVGGVAGPTGPNSVPSFWVTIPSGSAATAPQAVLAGVPVRTFSGSPSDTVVATDRNSQIFETFGGALTLNVSSLLFTNGFAFKVGSKSANSAVSITPSTGTCNGSASCSVTQGQNSTVTLDATGSNLMADVHDPPLVCLTGCTLTPGDYSLGISVTGALSGSGTTNSLAKFTGSTAIGNADLSGDATTSGTTAVTVVKVNGVAYGTSPSTNTVPVVTGSNTVTYEAVPNAALANTATTPNGQTCTLGSTCNVNSGATNHSLAINKGAGAAISGVVLTTNQVPIGATGADPTAGNLSELSATLYGPTDSGTSTAFAACSTPAAAALHAGQLVSFLPAHANTSNNPTLAWCSLTPATIVSIGGATLANNDIITTQVSLLLYDGTNFELQNPQTNIISGSVLWNSIGNAAGNLTLANGANTSTFNQTSNAAWTWANTTAATVSVPQSSPVHTYSGKYWGAGPASATDTWTASPIISVGLNAASTFTFTHSAGTTGTAAVSVPNLTTPGFLQMTEGSALTGVAGFGMLWANSTSHHIEGSLNGGAVFEVPAILASSLLTSSNLVCAAGTITLNDCGIASANVVTLAGSQTLTNKTLTSPTLTTPAIGAATGTSLLVTGNLDGTVPLTITTGTTATLGGTFKSGYTFNQEATAGTAVAYTLPTAAAGLQYCVGNSWNGSAADTGVLTVNTSASGQFIIFTDGTLSATGGNVTSGGAAVDAACFIGTDATHWMMYVQRGTWTKH